MQPKVVLFDEADWLEFAPVVWRPNTGDERLAAIVGYMTGDGAIAESVQRYTRKDGGVSVYPRLQGAFYSNVEADLAAILNDCRALGMAISASVRAKKVKACHAQGYQVQIGHRDTRTLVDAGAPIGKKTSVAFEVPSWIRNGEMGVKRAYIGALFGAEGTAPAKDRSSKARMPRQPTLNMCKNGANGEIFFDQLRQLLIDLGVEASTTKTEKDGYATYWLRVAGGAENLIRFFENVGYVYCDHKAVLGWQWAKYLRAYQHAAKFRRTTALELRAAGETYDLIGRHLGISKGAAHRLLTDINRGRETTAGHGFPHFKDWLSERWVPELGLLRLAVTKKTYRDKTTVWNMLVSSPDHSYVLASGVNNFNSFETMSGRVYYPFDRNIHVGQYEFNPKLPIWVGQDFNIDPMSSVILQPQPNGEVWAVGEIVLFGSNTEEVTEELEKRFWRNLKQVTIYPDPAGGSRQHARGETDLDIFREKGFSRIKHRRKHPAVADRINAVNRMIKTADGQVRLKVDRSCKHLIESLEQTIYKAGSRDIDKTMGIEHITDALGYPLELEFPVRKIQLAGLSR